MPLKILKILYWLLNVVILYVYFSDKEKILALPFNYLLTFAIVWVVLSIIYGYHLLKYLLTRGKEGTLM